MNTKIQLFSLGVSILVASIIQPTYAATSKIVYPLKEVSKLECRFQDFDTLSSSCKEDLPVLKTKDYKKYAKQNDGYNDFTRLYTVLWGASYTYGWDTGHGGHQGVDIATAKGTPVYSIADGVVIVAKQNDIAWGNVISIEHTIDGKKVVSDYAHLSKIDIQKGDNVSAGEKIGEVGSTGNSTGNHLHFQIDLSGAPFYPYYYSYKDCPYSYYEITENGVCFDVLTQNTLDPLAFLETSGANLSEIQTTSPSKTTNSSRSSSSNTSSSDYKNIFETYIYLDTGSSDDVKMVQQIYKDLGYYTGKISGRYSDVLESIIDYQVATGVISKRSDDGAGYFGPKTRAQTQKDYITYIVTSGAQDITHVDVVQTTTEKKVTTQRETISKEEIKLTREQIEKKEREDFLKNYSFDIFNSRELKLVSIGETKEMLLTLRDKKGKGFRGNTPGDISFSYDADTLNVFPGSFYYFDNGERLIKVTGLKEGSTKLDVLLGGELVKTFQVIVSKENQKLSVTTGQVYMVNNSVIGDAQTGLAVLKDNYGNIMMGKEYEGTYSLESNGDILYCLKTGDVKKVQTIFKKKCADTEYSKTLTFTYEDTIAGLLIFDYKALSEWQVVSLKQRETGKDLGTKMVTTSLPKGLEKAYAYYDDVLKTLKEGITASGLTRGYFMEDRSLNELEAYLWIENTLLDMLVNTNDTAMRNEISSRISQIQKENPTALKELTRKQFLEGAVKYLSFDNTAQVEKDFLDLDETEDVLANAFFGKDVGWRDSYGDNYFRPNERITRGEGAYLVALALEKTSEILLTYDY